MRLTPLMAVLISVGMAGCASHSVDCTKGAGQNGCTPGTQEYEQMMQRQQAEKSSDYIDDAVCQSMGAQPGSTAYDECRHKRTEDSQMFEPARTPQAGSAAK
jgi:hypothetical protein